MGGESKIIGSVEVVTDTEVSYINIGDVEGGFDEIKLKEFLDEYGEEGYKRLSTTLTCMAFQIQQAFRTHNAMKHSQGHHLSIR